MQGDAFNASLRAANKFIIHNSFNTRYSFVISVFSCDFCPFFASNCEKVLIMKKLIIVILSFVFVSVASAQKVVHGGGYYRPHTVIVGGYAPIYPYGFYGSPFFGYPPYAYGYNNSYSRPSKLDMQVEDIKHDYSDRIKSAKMDDSLTRKDRKAKVRELKQERDNAIYDAKRSYYKS